MKTNFYLLAFFLSLQTINAQSEQKVYVKDVSNPVISLNGTWEICLDPTGKFWGKDQLTNEWHDIQVPGEVMMQGFPIRHDKPFAYKKTIKIPADFNGKIIKIRFEGVYSYARIWVNGTYLREHYGGFTSWDYDITSKVVPGNTATLIVEVTDKSDEISYASGYAKHQIGGILRNVSLLASPVSYPKDILITTDLDENFHHASLIIKGELNRIVNNSRIKLELYDKEKNQIELDHSSLELDNKQAFQIINPIKNPKKWDAEHPNLYCLRISFEENEIVQWQKSLDIGFRELDIDGNKLRVNGREVRLRGACRHDIHPLLGRVSTPDYELKDVLLAKESNMNFIRTSHYPPSDNFLKLCDKFGLYVEVETAVCFVGTHRSEAYHPGDTENDPEYAHQYISQLEEMLYNFKNHPSVIIWSIGNENLFGSNFKRSYEWVKAHDDTRPVIFSYPGHVPDSVRSYEILSMHYPGIQGNMDQYGIKTDRFGYEPVPVLFDEWAHVACYNHFSVKEDPNIRDFWGRSLDFMWQNVFDSDGGLGGAIWGMVDETFMLPESLPGWNEWWGNIDRNENAFDYAGPTVGYGEWGIVDTWRRKKPEFWNTKKAYSPVKLLQTDFEKFNENESLIIPLYNRFDHTNINETTIKLTYKGQEKFIDAPNIEAHSKGYLHIPINAWTPSEPIFLEFFDCNQVLIDTYSLRLSSNVISQEKHESARVLRIEERRNRFYVTTDNNKTIIFDKGTGLIHEIQTESDTFSLTGPFINLRTKGKEVRYTYNEINDYGKNWILKNVQYQSSDQHVILHIKGDYEKDLHAEYKVTISSTGEIKIHFDVNNIPEEYIRELGIRFVLEDVFDSLNWSRNGYWTYYPPDHLSSEKGTTSLHTVCPVKYRAQPGIDWNLESSSFFYDGLIKEGFVDRLTYIAKSTKENVSEYRLSKNNMTGLTVVGNENISCRIARKNDGMHLYINNVMDYVDLGWGNYQNNILREGNYSNEVRLFVR